MARPDAAGSDSAAAGADATAAASAAADVAGVAAVAVDPAAGSGPLAPGGEGAPRVLVVAGTHGNERNAPWLLEAWRRDGGRFGTHGLAIEPVEGNPDALQNALRYLERDLNRSFDPALLSDPACRDREVQRARALLDAYGPAGRQPCLVALDLHSTTAAMGNSLVVYGRRPADLALAAALQGALGLPIYLHEADARQSGFLVERWPCGLVIEVGPVPQGVLTATVVNQTALALDTALALLAKARSTSLALPRQLVVHRHCLSLDLPRTAEGLPAALIHPQRQHRDWQPLESGEPLFLAADGRTLPYVPPAGLEGRRVWPVFINEAAYGEKGIALSLTEREVWPVDPAWAPALQGLAGQLALAGVA